MAENGRGAESQQGGGGRDGFLGGRRVGGEVSVGFEKREAWTAVLWGFGC